MTIYHYPRYQHFSIDSGYTEYTKFISYSEYVNNVIHNCSTKTVPKNRFKTKRDIKMSEEEFYEMLGQDSPESCSRPVQKSSAVTTNKPFQNEKADAILKIAYEKGSIRPRSTYKKWMQIEQERKNSCHRNEILEKVLHLEQRLGRNPNVIELLLHLSLEEIYEVLTDLMRLYPRSIWKKISILDLAIARDKLQKRNLEVRR
jgi:hypothetical protein